MMFRQTNQNKTKTRKIITNQILNQCRWQAVIKNQEYQLIPRRKMNKATGTLMIPILKAIHRVYWVVNLD